MAFTLKTVLFLTVIIFSLFSLLVFVAHERQAMSNSVNMRVADSYFRHAISRFNETSFSLPSVDSMKQSLWSTPEENSAAEENVAAENFLSEGAIAVRLAEEEDLLNARAETPMEEMWDDGEPEAGGATLTIEAEDHDEHEKIGKLMCDGKETHSEIIYWKIVPGDNVFESPITPHHGIHHDRYLTFEYDNGGWNNIRMALECLMVTAHAMGRTVVLPPSQKLYLLTTKHKDKGEEKMHSEMGFEDFFALDILKSHQGFHVITMKEFLEKEGQAGGLHGKIPPGNSSDIWGPPLWQYLESVADEKPQWGGRFVAFPDRPGDFNFSSGHHPRVMERMKRFAGDRWSRKPIFYDEILQKAHHLHFPGREHFRVLQHHYAFAFFASPAMQSFYKRFVRDYMRYRDEIQCLGHELVAAVRADARANGVPSGDYYSMHIRRGDLQYKEVKISAAKMLENLVVEGKPLFPPGSFVYISTDDPDGVCRGCRAEGKDCSQFNIPKPVGCPDDPSWDAFTKFGWKIRFLKDYLGRGHLKDSNPNVHGMVESIVCSRSKRFAGTWFSTFTGYIHRLRGYHGMGESSYYHSTGHVTQPQSPKSIGHGFAREFRAGWTDDAGELI